MKDSANTSPRKQKAILPDDQAAALAKAAERQRKVDLTKARQASEKATEDALEKSLVVSTTEPFGKGRYWPSTGRLGVLEMSENGQTTIATMT